MRTLKFMTMDLKFLLRERKNTEAQELLHLLCTNLLLPHLSNLLEQQNSLLTSADKKSESAATKFSRGHQWKFNKHNEEPYNHNYAANKNESSAAFYKISK